MMSGIEGAAKEVREDPPQDPIARLQAKAGEAVMRVNVDPSSATSEEHEVAERLQYEAGQAVIRANLELLALS